MATNGLMAVPHAGRVLDAVAARSGGRVLLFYSGGKDSLVLLDLARQRFKEVVCVFMYFVPGLEHCELYLRYAAQFRNVRVVQYEHPDNTLYRREGTYCQADPDVKLLKVGDVSRQASEDTGIEWSLWGMKKADSLNRRIMLASAEYEDQAIHNGTHKAYPLTHWTNALVDNYRERYGLPRPIKYGGKASNGVGLTVECLSYLRAYWPRDLQRIYDAWPGSEQILFEYDYKQGRLPLL